MKYFIMLLIVAALAAFPFELTFSETHDIACDGIRGMDVHYGCPGNYAISIFQEEGAVVALATYSIYTWEIGGWFNFGLPARGFAQEDNPTYWFNDEMSEYIYNPGASAVNNPASDGWGMALLSTIIWETDGSDGIWYLGSTDTIFVSTPEITSQMFGLSDYDGNMLLSVTADQKLHAWIVSGSSLSYEGSIDIPISATSITGVAWDPQDSDILYIAYETSGSWYIGEFEIGDLGALEAATWGSIKSSF